MTLDFSRQQNITVFDVFMKITGIGSRKTPVSIGLSMWIIGKYCNSEKIWVSSGGSGYADKKFEEGATDFCLVYWPWKDFDSNPTPGSRILVVNRTPELDAITNRFHPNPNKLTPGARLMINRDAYQVLGLKLDKPSDAVVCWTPDGKDSGGTGQAIRIANHYGIPVLNMFHEEYNTADKVLARLEQIRKTI